MGRISAQPFANLGVYCAAAAEQCTKGKINYLPSIQPSARVWAGREIFTNPSIWPDLDYILPTCSPPRGIIRSHWVAWQGPDSKSKSGQNLENYFWSMFWNVWNIVSSPDPELLFSLVEICYIRNHSPGSASLIVHFSVNFQSYFNRSRTVFYSFMFESPGALASGGTRQDYGRCKDRMIGRYYLHKTRRNLKLHGSLCSLWSGEQRAQSSGYDEQSFNSDIMSAILTLWRHLTGLHKSNRPAFLVLLRFVFSRIHSFKTLLDDRNCELIRPTAGRVSASLARVHSRAARRGLFLLPGPGGAAQQYYRTFSFNFV